MTEPTGPGTRIGPYEIVGWLGSGGMGEVYRARDPRLGRDVAVKLITASLSGDSTRVRRFEQEARAAGQLNHPNVLAVYDIGVHDGVPYIVSELLAGRSLRSRLADGSVPWRKVLDYAKQTAEGLAAAHDRGIIHRDVKPDNLFITTDGRIKILDFGIAKLAAADERDGRQTGLPTDTAAGTVVGTAAYMSPEQVRGETVDARSDIFSLGSVLYEMLTGRVAFRRDTAAETMAAILKEDPPEAPVVPDAPALARIVSRCLEKSKETRFQSARDLAFGLDVLTGSQSASSAAAAVAPRRWWPVVAATSLAGIGVAAVLGTWLMRSLAAPPAIRDPFADPSLSILTDWEGAEAGAEISPDGRYVAFVADRDGEFDLWITQIGTGIFTNLTRDRPALRLPGPTVRTFGFNGDGSDLWVNLTDDAGGPKVLIPITGGPGRSFLGPGDIAPAWSPDGTRVAYLNNKPGDGDPLFVAGRLGADATRIVSGFPLHNHNPVWSYDGEWIYFVHGIEPSDEMAIWRVRADGSNREQLTQPIIAVNYLATLGPDTIVFVARDRDRSGPWLWTLDLPSRATHRVMTGMDRYVHVSASHDGRRIAATVARPKVDLWRVPIRSGLAEDRDTEPYTATPSTQAFAPRFGGDSLFYVIAHGAAEDGVWRVKAGERPSQVWNASEGVVWEPPAVSRDGTRVVVVLRENGKRHLMSMAADGSHPRTLAPSLDIRGAAGQSAADFSPDGGMLVTGGVDAQGEGLFLVPLDGGAPHRLLSGSLSSPVWSDNGQMILYSGPYSGGYCDLLAVRPDGSAVPLPAVKVRQGGYRLMPDRSGMVLLTKSALDFQFLDFTTKTVRPMTGLTNRGAIQTFDVTPDSKYIVFDRLHANSDVVLIELPKPGASAPGPVAR